ncbi:hypothetical protein A9R16_006890 [Acidiferrobacter thiooxydans]|uniref:hypothetical protein n=1 Tax=Acidiferrobacter thiooxydans TaxID=163359 RepID=UPI000824FBEB|nr:hypothetical protein [Acidiferrobacter thiooxydans]UEO01115.1 hypothetical protein A9R16_006890 [Acidiferrobacter thiooxydans]
MTAVQTAILMAITVLIDLLLLACHIPFWLAALVTLGIFLGAEIFLGAGTYYYHAQGGHEDDDA